MRAGDEEELAVGADGVGPVYVEGEGAGEEAVGVEFAEVTAGGEGVGEVGVGVVAADDVAEVVGFVGAEDGGAAAQRLCLVGVGVGEAEVPSGNVGNSCFS